MCDAKGAQGELSGEAALTQARPRAVVLGCAGTTLSDEERALFAEADPLGFILFARNCEDPRQVRALVDSLRDSVGRADALVLIDQEGGRVARLRPPAWPEIPAARRVGRLAEADLEAGVRAAALHARLIAGELNALGITVNCAPVLDLGLPGTSGAIGDRAYAAEPSLVARLGAAACAGYLAGGVLPVLKHIPGQGRATADSHIDLPVVATPAAELQARDCAPFKALRDMPLGMTGHVVFTAFDATAPVTISQIVIEEVIRGAIGFDGLLFSDDLAMGALKGTIGERAAACLEAGCDVALYCWPELDKMRDAAEASPRLSDTTARRLAAALDRLRPAQPAPGDVLADELSDLLRRA